MIEGRCQCGWPVRTTVSVSLRCPQCSQIITIEIDGSEVIPVVDGGRVCPHRGDIAGSASCGCGVMYHCNKLGVVCSDRRPAEPLFTITLNTPRGSMQLSEEAYRSCSDCPDFHAG